MIIVMDQNKQIINVKRWKFPAGEYGIRLLDSVEEKHVTVLVLGINKVDLMEVLQLVDAIKRGGAWSISVLFNYLPYARQDKVHSPGESLALRLVETMLVRAGASSIKALEVHNPSATTFIKSVSDPLAEVYINDYDTIVLPDEGAKNRYDIPEDKNVAYGVKARDKATGEITSYTLEGTVSGRVLVLDDICDGGRTFVELGKLLPCKADLYVTHGIFSKGKTELYKYYDNINSFHVA